MQQRDKLGYYQLLGINPDAGGEDVEMAYAVVRQAHEASNDDISDAARLRTAYRILSDPKRRGMYDPVFGRSAPGGANRYGVQLPTVLFVLLAVLSLLLLYRLGPSLREAMMSYAPGDTLVWTETGARIGVVQRYEAQHEFPNGARADAYLVEIAPDQPLVWYPSRDLVRLAQPGK